MLKIANYCLFFFKCSYQCSLVDALGHDDAVSKSPQNQFGICLLQCLVILQQLACTLIYCISGCNKQIFVDVSSSVYQETFKETRHVTQIGYGKDIKKKNYKDGTAWGTVLFAEVRLEWGKRRNRTAAVPGRSVCIHYVCVAYVRPDLEITVNTHVVPCYVNETSYLCIRMPKSATRVGVLRQSFGRSYSSEEMEHDIKGPRSVSLGGYDESAGRPFASRKGPKLWSVVALSALGSAAAVAVVGCFCALVYPILKGKRAHAHVCHTGVLLWS